MSNVGKVAKALTAAPVGYDSLVVEVECDMKAGLPSLQIVGMGSKAIDEARERVRSAIANSQLDFPAKKFIINLAPAELPKDGSHYDLAIAIAILTSSGQLRQHEVNNSLFAGELGLDGSIRPVKGIVSIVEAAQKNQLGTAYIPADNAAQAELVENINIQPVNNLQELFLHLKHEHTLPTYTPVSLDSPPDSTAPHPLLDDVLGQDLAKRALTIAAAGFHNILLTGPPGAGKSMLAKILPSLMPTLTQTEKIAVTKLHSLTGGTIDTAITNRPFRSPHHTSSRISLIGGGNPPKPGDISLAHLGVLFLDEIPEYPRASIEALRQPLEDGRVIISRANGHAAYPANFMLVATMNPCPCGYYGDARRECSCSSQQILKYQQRLSGPLLDRIDLVIRMSPADSSSLIKHNSKTSLQHTSAQMRVNQAIDLQINRYKNSEYSNSYNSSLDSSGVRRHIKLDNQSQQLLRQATDKLALSTRSYFKIIKVARTIADIDGETDVLPKHIAEALQYRLIDS